MKKVIFYFMFLIVVFFSATAQRTVSGRVTDDTGAGLPGATVIEVSTTNGTVTDADGNYRLSAGQDATLLFSYVGYLTQEISVNGRQVIDVQMEDDPGLLLNEVVVIGYGEKRKKDITGAIGKISGNEIRVSPSIALGASLAGRLPGLIVNQRTGEPGRDGVNLLVRGLSTTGGNTPLIVVDGVANRDGISRLDPEDIESITVLKDASAAIYGAQAAGGVILVTTKRGVQGKPSISYNYNHGFVQITRLPQLADAYTFAEAWNELNRTRGQQETYSEADLQKYKDGSSPLTHPNTSWLGELYKDWGHQNRHNLSVRGGNEKVTYFLSLGTADQTPLFRGSSNKFKQYTFRSNVDVNIAKNLKVGLDISGRREDKRFAGGYQSYLWVAMRQAPTEVAVFPNGGFSEGSVSGYNPLAIIKEGGYRDEQYDLLTGTLRFEWNLPWVKGLSVDGFFGLDSREWFYKRFTTPWSVTTYDSNTDTYSKSLTSAQANVTLWERTRSQTSLTPNIKLNYSGEFGRHTVSAFVAYEQNQARSNSLTASRNKFESPLLDIISAGSSDKQQQGNGGSYTNTARQNYFGRLSYRYQDKYLLDFNFRYDGSVNFPQGQRFGFFPGVSVGWRISEEAFMPSSNFINELKLRASYGAVGNDCIYINDECVQAGYEYLQKFSYDGNYVFGGRDEIGVRASGLPISNLTWETTTMLDIGVDALLLEGKIGVELDVFRNRTTNMLINRDLAIPNYAGFSPPKENAGEMENRGAELTLSYQNDFGLVGFRASGNFSYARNKVLYIDEVINEEAPWQAQTDRTLGRRLLFDAIGFYKNQSDIDKYPYFQGLKAGIGDLIYRDVDDDGVITNLDRIPIEQNATPQITFGLNLGASYQNFDLSLLFQGQALANQPVGYRFDNSGNVLASQLENRVSATNPDGANPRAGRHENYWARKNSTFWLRDAAFVRLKTLQLGYTFSGKLLEKMRIGSIHAYVSGFNLLTISEIKGQDPEITSNEGTIHPQTRVYNLGIRIRL